MNRCKKQGQAFLLTGSVCGSIEYSVLYVWMYVSKSLIVVLCCHFEAGINMPIPNRRHTSFLSWLRCLDGRFWLHLPGSPAAYWLWGCSSLLLAFLHLFRWSSDIIPVSYVVNVVVEGVNFNVRLLFLPILSSFVGHVWLIVNFVRTVPVSIESWREISSDFLLELSLALAPLKVTLPIIINFSSLGRMGQMIDSL